LFVTLNVFEDFGLEFGAGRHFHDFEDGGQGVMVV
jgi:hypothetical protein